MKTSKIIGVILAALFVIAGIAAIFQRQFNPELNKPETFSRPEPQIKSVSTEPQSQTKTTTFLVGGDVSLSRNIAYSIDQAKDPLLPFKDLENTFNSVDFTFANLETPFSESNAYTARNTLVFNAPKKNIEGLVKYKFNVLALANNHAFDQGLNGLKTTRAWLSENNILHTGTGENLDQAWEPVIYESNGIKIGFISASYSSINDGGKASNNNVARFEHLDRLKLAVAQLKADKADYIIVAMHGGTEYTRAPNKGQITFARASIDAGADIVIGHHPHWIETIEQYKDKYIFYSLGNFIFDQNWSQDTREGLLLQISLQKTENLKAKLDSIELLPIIIENNSTPRLANLEETKTILKNINQKETIIR